MRNNVCLYGYGFTFRTVYLTRPQCKKSENERMTSGGMRVRGLCLCSSLNNAAANAAGSEQAKVVTGTLHWDGRIFKAEMIDFKIATISLW